MIGFGCPAGDGVLDSFGSIEHIENFFGVGFPVGGDVDDTPGAQEGGQKSGESRGDEPAFVVALLGPGIGEPYVECIDTFRGDGFGDDFRGVAFDDADVGEFEFVDPPQEFADARTVNFDADEGPFGMGLGRLSGGIAHAETDFHDPAGGTGKPAVPVQGGMGREQELRCMGFVGAALGIGHAGGPDNVASDAAGTHAHGFS